MLRWWTKSGGVAGLEFQVDHSRGRTGLFPPASGVVTAHAVTLAATVLRSDDESIYVPIIRRLLSDPDGKVPKEFPSGIIRHWGAPSPGLECKILKAIEQNVGPHSALRYRTAGSSPSPPPKDQSQVLARARSVPQRFWPGWIRRLQIDGGRRPEVLQTALSVALLLPGCNRSDLKVQHEALGLSLTDHSFTYIFQRLPDSSRKAVMQALLVLASYLDEHPAPIDYQRRRQLPLGQLPPLAAWQDVHLDHRTSGNTTAAARRYVAYRVTGSIPDIPEQGRPGYFLMQNFIAATPAGILDLLDEYASRFLRQHSIMEPLSWEPPMTLLDDISMPAQPARQIDPILDPLVGRGLVDPRLIRQIENGAVRTLEALRPGTASFHTRLRQALNRGDSVSDMAVELKRSERMIRHHITRLGLPTKPAGKIQLSFDEIREMYLVQRLAIQEIADATGWDKTTVRRLLLLAGVPLRGTGSYTGRRGIDPHTYAEFPALLKNALRGNHGAGRLQRFAIVSAYPTLDAAVRSLGLSQPALSSQIRGLERDVGGEVLTRANRWHGMELTSLGRTLIEVAREGGLITPTDRVVQKNNEDH